MRQVQELVLKIYAGYPANLPTCSTLYESLWTFNAGFTNAWCFNGLNYVEFENFPSYMAVKFRNLNVEKFETRAHDFEQVNSKYPHRRSVYNKG